MNRGLIVGLAILGVFVLVIGGGVLMFVNAGNTANRYERGIEAQYDSAKVKLSEFSTSIMEAAQVPAMYRDDLKDVIETSLTARYGENGTQSAFSAIAEAYPGQLDPSLYTRIQDRIASGRANFAAEQKQVVDRVREYRTALGAIPTGFLMGVMGYPKIDLNDFSIITDNRTREIFDTKVDETITLR